MNAQHERYSHTRTYTGLYPVGSEDTRMSTIVAHKEEIGTLTYRSSQFLMLRPELVQICDCDAIEAFILRIVETKMQQGLEWVSLSYQQIKNALYHIVSSENTIITKLTNLLKRGFLKRRENPEKPHAAPQYRLDIATTQKALDSLASVFDGGVPIIGTPKSVDEEIPVPIFGTGGYQKLVPPVPEIGTGEYQKLVPIIDKDITKKIEDKRITFTIVNADELRPYIDGYEGSFTLPYPELECDAEDVSTPLPPVDTPSPIASPMATRNETSVKETRKPTKSKNALTLAGQHILEEYQKFKGRKSTPGKATIEAANGLVDLVANDEEFTAVLTEIRDNKYLNDNSIARDLDFVYRKYERYRDIVEQKATKRQPNGRPAPPPGITDYTGMGKLLHRQEAPRGQTFTA